MFYLTAFVLLIAFFIFYKVISKRIIISSFHITTILLVISIMMFVALIISFPRVSFLAATTGVNLWFNIVFPSLLPFLIGSELLIGLGFVNFLGTLLEPFMRFIFNVPGAGSFALAMGLTSGYPTGARVTASLREKGLCSKTEGERLLTFTNNSSPLFIIGAVAVGMFNSQQLGMILALAHFGAAITVGILFRFYKKNYRKVEKKDHSERNILKRAFKEMFSARRKDGRSIGILLGDSVKNSVSLLLMIGGFIIFFSVIISLLNELNIISAVSTVLLELLKYIHLDLTIINSILSGIFEITTGCRLASLSSTEYIDKVIAAAFIMGWAGLSVHMQVISIISKTDISPLPYLAAKFIQGIISGIYTFILFRYWFNPSVIPTFISFNSMVNNHWFYNYQLFCVISLFALLIFMLFKKVAIKKYRRT